MATGNHLTERQKQIIQMASEGHTDKEIAKVTGLSEGTLRTYWERLRHKFSARSRSEVIAKVSSSQPLPDLAQYMLKKLPLYIWTADPSGYVDFCNDWFFTEGKLTPQQALGLGCRALMPDSELSASAERWRKAKISGSAYEALVHFRCGASGELRPHKIRLTPLKDADGKVVKWIGYGRELAENADEQMVLFLRSIVQMPA